MVYSSKACISLASPPSPDARSPQPQQPHLRLPSTAQAQLAVVCPLLKLVVTPPERLVVARSRRGDRLLPACQPASRSPVLGFSQVAAHFAVFPRSPLRVFDIVFACWL
ncbi:hypothetical protein PIB30_000448 [Stylosanthes scabra]|uniref:Uncharacterized protein n=1 Tax=Stylosanthes scabra TaxID=79078 RepID=A0ABU6V4N8_9FABA|nr:hypothetical protein [Stylosanthes scabra]